MFKLMPNSELEVMKVIWEEGDEVDSKTVTEIVQKRRNWKKTTILTLLNRLSIGGFILVDKTGRRSKYTATISRDEYAEKAIISFANSLYSNKGYEYNEEALDKLIDKCNLIKAINK